MADTKAVDVGTKDVKKGVRRITALVSLPLTADHPAQASKIGREVIDGATKGIELDGFRLASREERCPTCGKTERRLTGFEANKRSTVTAVVSVLPKAQESLEDFNHRLDEAIKGTDLTVLDVREGS